MSVSLPSVSGTSVQPEYAATAISFNRGIKSLNGVIVPVFTCSLSYQRTDYLLGNNGEKVGVISREIGSANNPEYFGNIYLDEEKTLALFVLVPDSGKCIGDVIADTADNFIREDLIRRGIIS